MNMWDEQLPCKDPSCNKYKVPHVNCTCYTPGSKYYDALDDRNMKNGTATYSKTPFKESKHARGKDGVFTSTGSTEKDKVSYHKKFTSKSHPRAADGSFKNDWKSEEQPKELSNGLKLGIQKYGKE